MIIVQMCGVKTKGLAATGGVVSPSSRKKKLSCKLTVMDSVINCYGKKTTLH